jgi:hypothetical protein
MCFCVAQRVQSYTATVIALAYICLSPRAPVKKSFSTKITKNEKLTKIENGHYVEHFVAFVTFAAFVEQKVEYLTGALESVAANDSISQRFVHFVQLHSPCFCI